MSNTGNFYFYYLDYHNQELKDNEATAIARSSILTKINVNTEIGTKYKFILFNIILSQVLALLAVSNGLAS